MTSHSEIEDELSKAALLRELEEARIRECQMEKTVRWWTACTAGWRQKWSKVRHERDSFKRQANTSATQLNSILNEIQQILDIPFSDESNSTLTVKLENILRKCRPKEMHVSPESLCEEINKPHDDEEVDAGAASDFNMPEMKLKTQHGSKAEKSEDCLIQRDKGKSVDVTASSINKANRSSLTMEHEKNESLLEIMSDELESIASEKKRLHKDVENLKSKKIVLKQEVRVSQLELDTLKEQLLMLRDTPRTNETTGPDLDKDRLLIENSTLRSQIRDLCYEICIAQEEIDKVSEQIIQLKEKNEEFLEHKMTCVKEIERLNLRLQLCGFYKEPIDSDRL